MTTTSFIASIHTRLKWDCCDVEFKKTPVNVTDWSAFNLGKVEQIDRQTDKRTNRDKNITFAFQRVQ